MTSCISLLGPTLDNGYGEKRWHRWRPNVALCQQEDLIIDDLYLLFQERFSKLANVIIKDIQSVSPETRVHSQLIEFDDPWDLAEVYGSLHDYVRAFDFSDEEDYLVNITTGTHVAQICWYLLTESHRIPARLIQCSPSKSKKEPAHGSHSIVDLDLSRYDSLAARFAEERQEGTQLLRAGIQTKNANYNTIIDDIEMVAVQSRAPILLTGATGTGKTHLARRIFELKAQRRQVSGAFVEVNCATLRGDQAMSMLFGHTKGAFTGAMKDRDGLLKRADNGLLFLDEIGELGLDEQAMLLRALEEGTWLPVGSDQATQADFQLLAGTNRDLHQAVVDGSFREDLLARIQLWHYHLPRLQDRHEDIPANLDFELSRYAEEHDRLVRFNNEAKEAFLKFACDPQAQWRGNFRDFGGAIERLCTKALNGRISDKLVNEEIIRLQKDWTALTPQKERHLDLTEYLETKTIEEIDEFDRIQLEAVITLCKEYKSCSAAGRALFAKSRLRKKNTNDADRLSKYLNRFGLTWDKLH